MKVSYYLLLFTLYFYGRDGILYRYSFYTKIFQLVYYQYNLLHGHLILPSITNKSIMIQLHTNSYLFISSGSTKETDS